jgi:hypothetical protein
MSTSKMIDWHGCKSVIGIPCTVMKSRNGTRSKDEMFLSTVVAGGCSQSLSMSLHAIDVSIVTMPV